MRNILILLFFTSISFSSQSQVEKSTTGAWYMYFYNHQFKDSQFGIQGDLQYRNWNILGDLEQLLIRSGITYKPKNANILFTLGYANITTGVFGDSKATTGENRIYQEALIPQKLGSRFLLTHRFRYEQRFVENQDFRTRYRYNLFLNVPLNDTALTTKTTYIALYNELFINGQTDIGDGRTVQLFDRNRTYLGLGYVIKKGKRIQLGWMNQKTVNWGKGQLQLSFHHSF
ncbi:MAG: DUF2490 domain-containing protein [Jejuia sp.]